MKVGLEKEMLVFDADFNPRNYELTELDRNFTVDFSDNQVELVSDVHDNIESLVNQMYDLLNEEKLVYNNIWPLSQPGINDYEVKYGVLGGFHQKYREGLYKKYGSDYMNISGIHFNFSYDKELDNPQEYYFDLMKKIYVFSPLISQFFSYTPFYQNNINDRGLNSIGNNKGIENALSLRNTYDYGYLNEKSLNLDYSNYTAFKNSIEEAILSGRIEDARELYTKLRLKENKGNVYLEFRVIDLNPFSRLGITVDALKLLKIMIDYIDKRNIRNVDVNLANKNFEKVALNGQDKSIKLRINDKEDTLYNHTINFLNEILNSLELNNEEECIINKFIQAYKNDNLDFNKFLKEITKEKLTIQEYGKKNSFYKTKFNVMLPEYDLELSTKILIEEAQKRNIEVEIIDENYNFLKLKKENKEEYVIQATKTNKDSYVNILLMKNKTLTKKFLSKGELDVPLGNDYVRENISTIDYEEYKDLKIVIKPEDTNFGLGITIMDKNSNVSEFDSAIQLAFTYSDRVLIEEFAEGDEYRFLVIDGKVTSIVKRIPANVVGDAIHTIRELVDMKNKNPLRNKGYITPLEYLELGKIEKEYLNWHNLKEDTIPNKNEVVYLRGNSNISTGGDSIEVFDQISTYYKDLAVKAANILGVKICGIDMIINNKENNYKIIEANFNPAIQMHTYPSYGTGKNPANDILNLLFKE